MFLEYFKKQKLKGENYEKGASKLKKRILIHEQINELLAREIVLFALS